MPSLSAEAITASSRKVELGLPDVWRNLMEVPIGEVIRERFSDDLVRGVVLTDALIRSFVSADDMQANRCFPYHLIGNGTGQWRVPQGGMGALVKELYRIATSQGVEIKLQSKVAAREGGPAGVHVETDSGHSYTAKDLLFAAAPQQLARLRGLAAQDSLEGSQMKINMLLTRLPRLKSGVDPRLAFAGTFHANESYTQFETAYGTARAGQIPDPMPVEMYCHTLTNPSILSPELIAKCFHMLALFGPHTPASLFDADPDSAKERAIASQRVLDYVVGIREGAASDAGQELALDPLGLAVVRQVVAVLDGFATLRAILRIVCLRCAPAVDDDPGRQSGRAERAGQCRARSARARTRKDARPRRGRRFRTRPVRAGKAHRPMQGASGHGPR